MGLFSQPLQQRFDDNRLKPPVSCSIASLLIAMKKISQSQSYVLRLWQVSEGGRPVFRISLENTQTRERRGFTDLEALLAFLRQCIETDVEREKATKED